MSPNYIYICVYIYIYICIYIYIFLFAKKNIHYRRESQGWGPVDSPTGKLETHPYDMYTYAARMKGMI